MKILQNFTNTATLAPGSRNTQHVTRFFTFFAIFTSALIFLTTTAHAAPNYTAHEWGTFTSVQGSSGELLSWRPLKSSELPQFVFSTTSGSGFNPALLSKVNLVTLQRMETPVIYFYSDQPMTVDVNVAFPKGFITEWYPQATQIGPYAAQNTNAPASGSVLSESRAIWKNLEILPRTKMEPASLPQDASGSHYFTARETGANFLRANYSNGTSETEKFIFYRGAGSFKTPLRVTLDSNNIVSVENTGAQPLTHLFLLNIHDGLGSFGALDELASSNTVTWLPLSEDTAEHWRRFPLPQFKEEIAAQVQSALIDQGLYPDEAKAMVNTWKDSWFTEEGTRVLYILPRPWTDETLPLKLTPQPNDLTRVMVGRAEIITDQVATNLFHLLTQAQTGNENARTETVNELKKLGRFADPALHLAIANNRDSQFVKFSYEFIYPPQTPAPAH